MEINETKKLEITTKVETLLRTQFNGYKAEVKFNRDRLNFSCPYCGDSANGHKKRANIYWKNLMFHCYNDGCKKHTNYVSFLKDFDFTVKSKDEISFLLDYIRANAIVRVTKDYLEINTFQNISEYAIPLDIVIKKLNLVKPEENLTIEKYLKARFMHSKLENFLYDPKKKQLYILHLTPDRLKVVGWQIRNFYENRSKYISYNIEKINFLLLNKKIDKPEEEIIKMNTISLYFNIMIADFTRPVTIFEGVIDSFLYRNSVAITGADKPTEMFDDIPTVRYMFDNDLAGRRIMESKLKRRKNVFMWTKMCKDFKIQPRLAEMDSVKDLNDLFTYCWKTKNEAVKNIEKYYTYDPLDIRSV